MAQPIPQIVHTSFILMMHRCERLTETMLQAPSSPTSEVRLRSVFCHNLHILNRPRPGRERDFWEAERREKSNADWFHSTASETTAQFLVIGLWRDVHVVENKVNKVADFFVDFDCRRT